MIQQVVEVHSPRHSPRIDLEGAAGVDSSFGDDRAGRFKYSRAAAATEYKPIPSNELTTLAEAKDEIVRQTAEIARLNSLVNRLSEELRRVAGGKLLCR